MFKLVALCVFAVAVAEPDPQTLLYGSSLPTLSYASYPAVVPATTIAQPASVFYSSPYVYSHFIKKRSADPEPKAKPEASPEAKPDPQFLTYGSSYYYPNTYSSAYNPFYSYSGYSGYPYSTYPLATHLIKKRSAQFLTPTSYVGGTSVPTYNPYYATGYLGNSFYSGGADLLLNQHLIKKRSAEPQLPLGTSWAGAYGASYSGIPSLYNSYIPSVPTTYLGNSYYNYGVGLHAIKKRSAQLLAPAYYTNSAYSAASPIYSSTYTASSPYISSLPYVASPYSYSTYIKK